MLPSASPLEPINFQSSVSHARQAFNAVLNLDVQTLYKSNTILPKCLKFEIENLKIETSKLGLRVDFAVAHFPTSAFYWRLEYMEFKVPSLESKLDSLITLLSSDFKTGDKVQSTRCRDLESVRKDDDKTNNDRNNDAARKGEAFDVVSHEISQKSKSQSLQSTQAFKGNIDKRKAI